MASTPSTNVEACKGLILSRMQGNSHWRDILMDIAMDAGFTVSTFSMALNDLEQEGKITEVIVLGSGTRIDPVYQNGTRPKGFSYRHITPLFQGTPEWIVEGLDPAGKPKLMAWCPREFDAQLIVAALNGAS